MEIDLIKQFETEINEQTALIESISNNVSHVIPEDHRKNLYETAHGFLGKLSAALQSGKNAVEGLTPEQTAAMLASLKILGQSDMRDAFNISSDIFNKIIRLADTDPNVTKFLINKIANHPSARQSVEKYNQLLTSYPQSDDNTKKMTLNAINKLRLGYERAHNKLAGATQQPQMGGTARPAMQ